MTPQDLMLPWGWGWGPWQVVTRLGETQLLFPTAVALGAWLAIAGERFSAWLWLSLFALAFSVTMATKVAFIGWGIGVPRLNMTGFSGHAMHAAAVFPVLLRCLTSARAAPVQWIAVAAGFAIAALVAVSRYAIGAHSASESVAGFVVGSVASALTLAWAEIPHRPLPRWLFAVLIAAQLLNPVAAPTLPTHGMVTRVALGLSGYDKPYPRAWLKTRGDCWVPRARGPSCS